MTTDQSKGVYAVLATTLLLGCASGPYRGAPVSIPYVGSSTVAIFLREAEPVYQRARFVIDTEPESDGGERAIVEGRTDLAGIAREPERDLLAGGIVATRIGRDAIATIVHSSNPVTHLSVDQLRAVFTGKMRNWRELGGPDLPIRPCITRPESATHIVFRAQVLHGEDYAGCQEISPDHDIVTAVANDPSGIGHISFSFLGDATRARALAVDGQEPSVTNLDYPLARPLYLLWRQGNAEVEAFVEWAQTTDGQRVVMRHFVSAGVVGFIKPAIERTRTGKLIVYTETYPVSDGGIDYYPHLPYEVYSAQGEFLKNVVNHLGENDELPTTVKLPPGTYIIRPKTSSSGPLDLLVKVEADRTTVVDVKTYLRK